VKASWNAVTRIDGSRTRRAGFRRKTLFALVYIHLINHIYAYIPVLPIMPRFMGAYFDKRTVRVSGAWSPATPQFYSADQGRNRVASAEIIDVTG
jgi:hypothetical protein